MPNDETRLRPNSSSNLHMEKAALQIATSASISQVADIDDPSKAGEQDDSSNSVLRRQFLTSMLSLGAVAMTRPAISMNLKAETMLGPIVGHCDDSTAVIWIRATAAGDYIIEITPISGGDAITVNSQAIEENDFCVHWHVTNLLPATKYRYRVLQGTEEISNDPGQTFATAATPDTAAKVRLAVSSCAHEDRASRDVWNRMATENVDAVLLLGDTPYIDSTELEKQTQRHREFASVAEYQALLRSRPCWWTWDDHDFAGNDASGLAVGKENSRLVFTRYRPQQEFGENGEGIYTSFRRGPVEVFVLDTRWFSMTEASFASPHKPTLLGKQQWEWLKKGLLKSTAPFKLLAGGVIWDDKENSESDDWGSYKHERTALEKFLGDNKISGVVLLGGDIHASRVLKYKTAKVAGYDLVQMIASPIHSSTIPSLNVYHPDLIRSAVEPNVFLMLEADNTVSPATLKATLINRRGETVFAYQLTESDLGGDTKPVEK
jgi:alkaline phosphatase D